MSTRISDAAALLLVLLATGCDRQPAGTAAIERAETTAQAQADDDGRILCARGDAPLRPTCTVERTQATGTLILTLRHPDGGFRRLQVTRDGRGVVAADGAEPARVAVIGPGAIEVTVGADRYRLPATIRRP